MHNTVVAKLVNTNNERILKLNYLGHILYVPEALIDLFQYIALDPYGSIYLFEEMPICPKETLGWIYSNNTHNELEYYYLGDVEEYSMEGVGSAVTIVSGWYESICLIEDVILSKHNLKTIMEKLGNDFE